MKDIIIKYKDKLLKALVDDEDFSKVSKYKWTFTFNKKDNYGYARASYYEDSQRKYLRMHRFILDAKPGDSVDHINNNGLDNRRCNIKICTHKENARAKNGRKPNIAKYWLQ